MTDQTQDQTQDDKQDDKQDTPVVDTSTFTRTQVDKFLDNRMASVKAAHKQAMEEASAALARYETVIASLVAEMSKDVPPPMLKLLEKLSPVERLEFLQDPENGIVFEKKQFPISKPKAKGDGEFKPSKIDTFV